MVCIHSERQKKDAVNKMLAPLSMFYPTNQLIQSFEQFRYLLTLISHRFIIFMFLIIKCCSNHTVTLLNVIKLQAARKTTEMATNKAANCCQSCFCQNCLDTDGWEIFQYKQLRDWLCLIFVNFTNFRILMMSTQGAKAHWRVREGEKDYV